VERGSLIKRNMTEGVCFAVLLAVPRVPRDRGHGKSLCSSMKHIFVEVLSSLLIGSSRLAIVSMVRINDVHCLPIIKVVVNLTSICP